MVGASVTSSTFLRLRSQVGLDPGRRVAGASCRAARGAAAGLRRPAGAAGGLGVDDDAAAARAAAARSAARRALGALGAVADVQSAGARCEGSRLRGRRGAVTALATPAAAGWLLLGRIRACGGWACVVSRGAAGAPPCGITFEPWPPVVCGCWRHGLGWGAAAPPPLKARRSSFSSSSGGGLHVRSRSAAG